MVNITLFSQGKMISPFFFPPDEGVLWVRQYINMPLFLLLGVSLHLVCLCIPNCSFFILAKESEVAQSCPTLCKPMDCSLPGSSIHGIFQAIVLEWVAIPFSRGSSWPRDWTLVSCIIDRRFNIWATRELLFILGLYKIKRFTKPSLVCSKIFSCGLGFCQYVCGCGRVGTFLIKPFWWTCY